MTSRNPVLRCLHHWPTRVLCTSLTILQAAALNWYLMHHLSYKWAAMYAADAIVVGLFMASFSMATKAIRLEKKSFHQKSSVSSHQPLTYVAWFVYGCILDIKVAFIFSEFSTHVQNVSCFSGVDLHNLSEYTAWCARWKKKGIRAHAYGKCICRHSWWCKIHRQFISKGSSWRCSTLPRWRHDCPLLCQLPVTHNSSVNAFSHEIWTEPTFGKAGIYS